MKDFWESIKSWGHKNKKIIPYVLIFVIVATATYIFTKPEKPKDVPYTQFIQMLNKKQVASATINLDAPTFRFVDTKKKEYVTDNPKNIDFKKYLLEHQVKVKEISATQTNAVTDFISYALKLILMLVIIKVAMDMFMNSKTSNMDEIKPDGKDASDKNGVPKVTFSKIAGNEEAKEEMQFLVEFLKNPKKYVDMGAKLPKGVIFYGPPGTGKTLTAKAIAGEAGVPFFSISGSDFVEMYVGLGAKRVRDLFKKARKKAPCIIFIDEIDAVGTKRGHDQNSERDQTINALLNELDGFSGTEGVIVICATNRIKDLDDALIRPGRFDKHIAIPLPEKKERLQILNLHAENKKLSEDINLEDIAKTTIGFAGADLEALLNEATILAVNRDHKTVTKEDVDDAFFKMVMQGHKKKNQKDRKQEELKLVAWHEAGHALVAKLLTDKEVPKVTIVSSTSGVGGVTFITPNKMGLLSKEEILNDIKIDYGGRVAEFLLLGDESRVTTGASSDIEQATKKIKNFIMHYGMGESFGMIDVSAFTLVDEKILSEATTLGKKLYQETLNLLTEKKALLAIIANELLAKESLDESELDNLIQ
ncbi:ATP-dependent metallopeptidase FtsH/Yme1/Tma family protein (plasmid) [Aneurinibacillus sp. Ricciae_BoGa-3]|uniref:ATP-dependent metallopeptidase FtsH/Yme1/Tma family protein n=1 Tax=Aneurinibacillus sp. Ricciae_BoGa-3 TaxID=3022697 RepID=UPI00233FC790|nr:FtsH/Yme1/Tma family ATP-dependent metallopeptidase [Aneurinibacillus sp. Ricciae_BoGa-3]WCK57313.1 ATP-dependent metallopeptidase FtsH/Yme1/Tma family protein [Aneurinibacillus sp. Ricciae_BoGa-3]